MKTIIELFDTEQIENIVSCFALKPEKIIFLGFEIRRDKRMALENFFDRSKIKPVLEYAVIHERSVLCAADRLREITDKNKECAIELTGGDEVIAAAIGIVAAERNIPIFRYDIKKGKTIGILNFSGPPVASRPKMSVEEGIRLYGGSIISSENKKLSPALEKDVEELWRLYSENYGFWNRQMAVISGIEGREVNISPMTVNREILRRLSEKGFIRGFRMTKNTVYFKFRDNRIRELFAKSGNLFEQYVFLAAKKAAVNGERYFNDVLRGVCVVWDAESRGGFDTTNEIDVIAMHGIVPIFISCKSGEVKKEALYELEAVAKKFGGRYAGKILAVTGSGQSKSRQYLSRRAADMGITVIDSIDNKSVASLCRDLINAVRDGE